MKKHLFVLISIVLGSFNSLATTTYTVGASRDYSTIAAAYAACSGATDYVIEIYSDYVYTTAGETGGITLSALSNKDATNTVTIRPAVGVTLSFTSTTSSIFTLDGADWVIFDGRAGGSGASAWTITNSNSAASTRVFTYVNDAKNNVLKYCSLKGDNSSVASGTAGLILFSTNIVGFTGNDSNTIDHCTFQQNSANPGCFIQSKGSVGIRGNSDNSITNCDFINFSTYAIWLEANTETMTISNNNFYQTAAQTPTTDVKMIYINCKNGHTISGNYLGGQAPMCGGSAYTLNNSSFSFFGIYCGGTTAGTTNTIINNTISNLDITNDVNNSSYVSVVSAIYTGGSGSFSIGTMGNGNNIGSTSGTGNINVSCNGIIDSNSPSFSAIQSNSSGIQSIIGNTIGSINYTSSVVNGFDEIALIRISTTSNLVTINNNILGNTTSDNVTINSNSYQLNGIEIAFSSIPYVTISSNTIQNLTVNDVSGGNTGKLCGIFLYQSFVVSIDNNIIKSLTNKTLDPTPCSAYFDASIIGINVGSPDATTDWPIYNNRITNLNSIYTGANLTRVLGILLAPTNSGQTIVSRNKIKGLTSYSSNPNSELIGIYLDNGSVVSLGTTSLYNNIILLSDASTSSKTVRGIVSANTTTQMEFYHNTVKLEATYTSGSANTSAITIVPVDSVPRVIENNIFQNLITGGSGFHYAQLWTSTYGSLSGVRYNYNEAPNASKLISYNGADKSISSWRTEISDGSNTEVTGGISISSTTGAPSSNSIVGGAGTPIGSITVDYDLNPRDATNPWIGAFELITALPIELLNISAKCQKSKTSNSKYGATVQWTTATEINSDYFIIEGSKNGFDWEIKDTINGAGTIFQPTNYYYHDDFINPTPENETVVYYRVSQTDFDGVINTYNILSCKCEASDKIKIHPVPATESIVINFGDQNNVPNSFQITDMFGHIIEDIVLTGTKEGNTSYKLDISNYSSGRYIIKINDWKMKEDAVFIKK